MWCSVADSIEKEEDISFKAIEKTCHSYIKFCKRLEAYSTAISFIQLAVGLPALVLGILRANTHVILYLIKKRAHHTQDSVKYCFTLARSFRKGNWAILFNILLYTAIFVSIIDILYSVYLWFRVRHEILWLHGNKTATPTARNTLMSLVIAPISAFCHRISFGELNQREKMSLAITNALSAASTVATSPEEANEATPLNADEVGLERLDEELTPLKANLKTLEQLIELTVPHIAYSIALFYIGFATYDKRKFGFVYVAGGWLLAMTIVMVWAKFSFNVGVIVPVLLLLVPLSVEVLGILLYGFVALMAFNPVSAVLCGVMAVILVGSVFMPR